MSSRRTRTSRTTSPLATWFPRGRAAPRGLTFVGWASGSRRTSSPHGYPRILRSRSRTKRTPNGTSLPPSPPPKCCARSAQCVCRPCHSSRSHSITRRIGWGPRRYNLTSFLTKRGKTRQALAPLPLIFSYKSEKSLCGTDAWAATFDELLTLDEARTDAPMHFPEPPPVAAPWTCPGCTNPPEEDRRRLGSADGPAAQHCSAKQRTCEGQAQLTMKQRRAIEALSHPQGRLGVAAPDMDKMDYAAAEAWIQNHSNKWMELPAPNKLTADEYMHWTQASRR